MMRDHLQVYSTHDTYSDETIYSSASASDSTNGSSRQSHKLRRQKSQLGNLKAPHKMSMHQQSQNPKQQQTQPYSAASQSGGGLRGVKQASDAGSSGIPGRAEHKPRQSQHSRSVSLLSRIRHTASPSASPTSSDNSSRDTRSERTLAHSASAGSIRQIPRPGDEAAAYSQQRRLSVKVLPPQDSAETQRPMRKRNSLRGDGKSGGFISQLLSRRASSRSRSPRSKSAQTVEAQPAHRFARSPGTPQSQRSAGSVGSGNSSRSPISIDDPDAAPGEHFHVSQCAYVSRPLASGQSQPHSYGDQAGMYCVGSQSQGDIYYIHDNQAAMPEHVMHEHSADREHMRAAYGHGMNEHKHSAAPYGHGGWYDINDSQMDSSRLVSALPVYEPIDMARMVEPQNNGSRYMRATQPTLPNAQMLAPMASLAGVCGAGDSSAALSNRELRFAVENHMLVEQHRYLIRDLGHARSAIGALKQVVQAKEERLEHCELANIELQQRIALLESVLTPEQRQHVLACMPYTSTSSPSDQPLEVGAAEGGEYSRQTNIDEGGTATAASGRSQAHNMSGRHELANSTGHGNSAELMSQQVSHGSEADGKRVNRPLSGFATGYSFNDRPVHQLPRVFSGDYSSSDVQAMENSVETLASAIASMPRDGDSVEDIIAGKPTENNCDSTSTYGSAAECNIAGEAHGNSWQLEQNNVAEEMPPAPPKRRSRFFAALRKSTAGLSTAGDTVPGSSTLKQKRRSVSLGNRAREQAAALVPETADIGQHQETGRSRADTDESLVASCPTLLPNIAKSRPLQKQRLSSASSQGSNGRYPSSLGLGLESGENSRQPSQQSSIGNASEQAKAAGKSRRKISQRLSFTPHPRRSTSAPSRPHSMRVSSRKSWLLQLFGVGSSNTNDYFDVEDTANDESFVDDAPLDAAKSRRRRVMTQSSDEISRFLGRLRLEENAPRSMAGSSGMLEDLLDDSGEDDEGGQSPLTVAQVRQQTLEALNGTLRGTKQTEAASKQHQLQRAIDDSHDSADTLDVAGSRWSTRRQKETLSPTIHRLVDTHATVHVSSASSMGLGIGASNHGLSQNQEQCADTTRRARSNTGGVDSLRVPRAADSDGLDHSGGSRWAPAFWVPPPQPAPSGSGVPNGSTWSPRNSIDSTDTAESLGRHASDSSKRFCQSPQGSFGHAASGSSSQGSHRGSSPWELVKMADAHSFPISPSHSRSGSPPSRALAFFEDTTVPDSDELTAAARRSLSLRMSRNSFKQVEPLPETDDSADFVKQQQLPTVQDNSNPDIRKMALGPQNPALARVAASGHTKRRSLLWQLNAKLAPKPPQQAESPPPLPKSETAAASGNVSPVVSAAPNVQAASDAARRSKKWWSSVLG
ncbi:hypothetical protein EV183_005150 [Coemansia sp. RSA 2336]|nr:hypothetical protein EV183_005150 [Coemansia sp. RSA 2336]